MLHTFCALAPAILGLAMAGIAGGDEPSRPGVPKVVREQVRGQWRRLDDKGLIGDALYPCGKEAAAFLEKLIGDRPVTCYSDSNDAVLDAKKLGRADAFTAETSLQIEMVRNGWAMAHHSGMAAWEVIARDNKRGLWRGDFVFPEKWRKGDRLSQEK